MANITVLQGQQISDCVSNSTGDISNWGLFLTENNFDSWTPNLFANQSISIPTSANLIAASIQALSEYPANNYSVPDITQQIEAIFEQMNGGMSAFVPNFQPIVADTNDYFTVLSGMQISDVISNATGDIGNWGSILDANDFSDWTQPLIAGQKIAIPSSVTMNLNNFRALTTYPANNYSVPDIDEQILSIFEQMNPTEDFILYNPNGQWNDENHFWRDGAAWLD